MLERPIIITFVNYYLPGYKGGGQIRAVANLVERLGNHFAFKLITRDRDLGDRAPYPGVPGGSFIKQGNGEVAYHSRVTIWKDPVIEMQRTKAHGLLYKQLRADSS